MRRVGMLAAAILALAGCTADSGGDGGDGPVEPVSHDILYDLHYTGAPGFKLQLQYTDANGQLVPTEAVGSTWAQPITVRYPDVTTVLLSGNAVPDPAQQPPLGAQLPQVQCILWVDGVIADQERSMVPSCQAELTGTPRPPRPSPSRTG